MSVQAVVLVARAEARRRLGSLAFLFILVAIVGSVVLSALAGAHRSATVLDRYLNATNQADVAAYVLGLGAVDAPHVLGAIPGVTQVSAADFFLGRPTIPGVSDDFGVLASPDPGFGATLNRYVVTQGRLPLADRADEVVLNGPAEKSLGLHVGDSFALETITPAAFDRVVSGQAGVVLDGPTMHLTVVGVIQVGEDLQGSIHQSGPLAVASPAFWHKYTGAVGVNGSYSAVKINDPSAVDRVRSAVSVYPQYSVTTVGQSWADTTRSAINVEVVALLAFAGMALIAGALAVGQAITRQVGTDPDTVMITRAMGFLTGERVIAAALPAIVTGAFGLVVAVGAAFVASGLFPLAIARAAEVQPGIHFDPIVLISGSSVLVLALTVWTLVASRHRDVRIVHPPMARARRSVVAVVGIGPRIAPRLGVRMALDPGQNRSTFSARSALIGISAGVTSAVAAIVFLASLQTAIATPADYGWTWSARPDYVGGGDPIEMLKQLAGEDDVVAAGGLFQGDTQIRGTTVPTQAFAAVKGSLGPPVSAGRLPTAIEEIALGSSTLRITGLAIGEEAEVTAPGGQPVKFTVVGEVVGSQLTSLPDLGAVAVITPDAAIKLTGAKDLGDLNYKGFNGNVLLTYAPGVDEASLETRLADTYHLDFRESYRSTAPGRLLNIEAMKELVIGLLAFSAVVAAVALAHTMIVSTRRRAREFGILAALGLLRNQLRSMVWTQACTLAVLGLVLGIPIGILVGRVAWRAAIASVGMIVSPALPLLVIVAGALAAVVASWVIALVPGWWAARTSAGTLLRTE